MNKIKFLTIWWGFVFSSFFIFVQYGPLLGIGFLAIVGLFGKLSDYLDNRQSVKFYNFSLKDGCIFDSEGEQLSIMTIKANSNRILHKSYIAGLRKLSDNSIYVVKIRSKGSGWWNSANTKIVSVYQCKNGTEMDERIKELTS